MALPHKYEGFEDALNIVAEIVSTSTGFPGTGSAAIWGIKEVLKDFPIQTHTLKKVLSKKNVKDLGIPDDKYDFVFEQTQDALSSIDSVNYNPEVFKKDIFTKNSYSPTRIGTILVENLHIDEDSDLLKAVRFVIAVYLLHWTEEPDFPLKMKQDLLVLKSNVEKNTKDIADIKEENKSLNTRVKNLEDANKEPIPAELTVIPKAITTLIGRESTVQDITPKLETDHILCINADGGLGKTVLAKYIINCIRNDIVKGGCKYKHVAWLTSSGNLKEDLSKINIPNISSDNKEDRHKKTCRYLQTHPTFLVIDNMDELPTPEDINILNTISGTSTILITSRATNYAFPSYELPPLDRDTAVALFYNLYFHKPQITSITHERIQSEINTGRIEDVYKIVDATGCNTLIIELIAKTALADSLSISDLWKKISLGIFGFESRTEVQTDHAGKYPKSRLSIDEQMRELYSMLKLSDRQKEIMSFISLFPAEHDIFSNVFKWAGFLDPDANDMSDLVERGWIIHEEDYYSIHTIVRDSINMQNEKSGDGVSINNYEKLIIKLSNIDSYIPRTMDYNLAQKLSFVPKTVGELLIENTAYNIFTGIFFNKLATLYKNQANYDEALKFCRIALKIFKKTLGKNHISTVSTYNNMAGLYMAQGKYDKALKFFNMALEFCEMKFGMKHPYTASAYNNIAGVYKAQGKYDDALNYYKTALEIKEKTRGKDHPSTATTYNNLAGLYKAQGKYDDALKFCKMALKIREKALGKDHPSTATTYNNIAGLYKAQGEYKKALKYYKMALEIRKRKLRQDHPSIATTCNNIAGLYKIQGKYDDALKYYKMALEIREKIPGKNNPSTATTYNNMAGLYKAQGKYDDALKFCKKALKIREKALGKDHPSTATTCNNMAGLYKAQGKYEDALEYYKRVLEIREKKLAQDHPSIAITYNNLAELYKAQGKYDEALHFFKMSLEIREKRLGKDHPSIATTYSNLAGLYKAQGEYDKALESYKTALTIREAKLGIHPDTAKTHEKVADIYLKIGNPEKSAEHLEKAEEIRIKLRSE